MLAWYGSILRWLSNGGFIFIVMKVDYDLLFYKS
jgi:hypothetical protein